MISDIYRIFIIAAVYLSASNMLNPDSNPIILLLPFGIALIDAFIVNGVNKIKPLFYIILILSIILSFINIDLAILPICLSTLCISINSKNSTSFSFSRAIVVVFLGILLVSVLINEPYVARYYSNGQVDIISFLDTSPQQFGTLALSAVVASSSLMINSKVHRRKFSIVMIRMVQLLCTVIQILIGERLLFILCALIVLTDLEAFKGLRTLKLKPTSVVLLFCLCVTTIYAIGKIDLNLSIASERLAWIVQAYSMLSDEGTNIIGSRSFHQVSDYSNLRYLVPYVSLLLDFFPLVAAGIIVLIWQSLKHSWINSPKLMLYISAGGLLLKNAGRITDPTIALYIFVIMLIPKKIKVFNQTNQIQQS